ncbi:hypothetical protein GWI33_004931 [Rhynchophorus ferrugineus]|uniref:Pectinesterase n=2 Tax=Rhynchophorus ferrugineus TaxID=354439 RepID=A0A834MJS9_RHYFE|nr:hypothetical protein GWI33_004931 [Rhynchophorus ferrugineus]
MKLILLLLVSCIVVLSYASHQNYPGTSTRPILSDWEASQYTESNYLNGWSPETINTWQADYTVGSGKQYSSIQEAVNAAIWAGGSTRKYIRIETGTYKETVYIPSTSVPITLYGGGGSPDDVQIVLSLSAQTTGTEYTNIVNPNWQRYKSGDPAYSMFEKCYQSATIGTSCSSVVWIKADNVQVANVKFENPSTAAQAVAVQTNGDKTHFENVHFYGFQDTLYLHAGKAYLNNVIIKGDVDFIFGSATAIFKNSQIIGRADRPRTSALMFAPSTDPNNSYGFLVVNCQLSAESKVASSTGLRLARAWDSGVSSGQYVPGVSPNGQLIIRDSSIAKGLNVNAPYQTSTSGRAFSTSTSSSRNLNDNNHNRFWEYNNSGDSA